MNPARVLRFLRQSLIEIYNLTAAIVLLSHGFLWDVVDLISLQRLGLMESPEEMESYFFFLLL